MWCVRAGKGGDSEHMLWDCGWGGDVNNFTSVLVSPVINEYRISKYRI